MPAPKNEPNSLPSLYEDWQDWRRSYDDVVWFFNARPGTVSDRLQLQIALQRLGFVGVALEAEVEFIVANRGI